MNLKPHPLAELFPLMGEAELQALAADIREHGQREPIVTHDGMILDGRNRWNACRMAKVEPVTVEWDGQGDIAAYVVSKNLHRRHLTESQRAMVAAKLANIARGQIGKGHEKTELQKRSSVAPVTVDEAADLVNVGHSIVYAAKSVLR